MSWIDPETPEEPPVGATAETTAEAPRPPSRPTGWHPVNVGHLVMGVAFLGLTVVWALIVSDTLTLADHRWLLPAPWIAAGAIGLAATAASRGTRSGPA